MKELVKNARGIFWSKAPKFTLTPILTQAIWRRLNKSTLTWYFSSHSQYKLYPGYDKAIQSTEKTYFNFKVFGFEMCTVRFQIARVHILGKLLRKNQTHTYNPIVRKGKGPYQRVRNGVKIYVTEILLSTINRTKWSWALISNSRRKKTGCSFRFPTHTHMKTNKIWLKSWVGSLVRIRIFISTRKCWQKVKKRGICMY